MDIFSSVVLAVVFLSGASVGALVTAAYRYAARNAIQREFQARLVAMTVEEQGQAPQAPPRETGNSEKSGGVLEELAPEDSNDFENDEDFAWITSHRPTPGSGVLRL